MVRLQCPCSQSSSKTVVFVWVLVLLLYLKITYLKCVKCVISYLTLISWDFVNICFVLFHLFENFLCHLFLLCWFYRCQNFPYMAFSNLCLDLERFFFCCFCLWFYFIFGSLVCIFSFLCSCLQILLFCLQELSIYIDCVHN